MQTTPENHEWYAFLLKSATWLTSAISVLIGVIGKICYELAVKRKLTFMQWIGVAGMSVFVGYVTSVWCANYEMGKAGYVIIPVSTLLGERILIYITSNYKEIFTGIINVFVKKK